ncbi:multidrug transporter subunit MdtD [Oxalobacter paraformigenes]|uniref:Drug:H+ antiporter-2 (14 Spanner) (DHA2) family drug resistance MFS transporter n=1 Tax=Oxalobacter paraformigenes TaxID=556268 RepID=C3X308_9BURK|nr:multidrug transporter subunit MdtD [Oxalobacter paraformigenes]EEO27594.1 drug:H+ antiporter-2 (14 Spanner) (DHA2) family drug resistance MFS transporter [Oxalobacter paraformigenes]
MADNPTLDPKTAKILPWVVAVAFFMQMLDGTILNTALPTMAKDLHTNPLQMQSVVIAYMLTVALIIPASGWLADKFGIKRIFLFAIALFTLGSLACGLSPTLDIIVACRVVQGIGGALMVPVGRLVVLRAYPREQLVTVLSFITIPGLIGPLIGPTLGGFLVEYASWHWIFFINIPVGIIGILSTLKYMPQLTRGGDLFPFDKIGFILFSTFMLTLTLGLEGIGELHLAYAPMVLLMVFGLVCLVGYVLYSRYTSRPLFSPDLFKIRNFSVGILGNLFARLGNGAMPFLTPLLLQIGLGYSPMKAGLSMIPMTVGALISKSAATRLVNRFGYRLILTVNTLLLGLMIGLFSTIDKTMNYWLMMAIFTVFGIINSLQFTAMNTVTLVDLSDRQASSGNSLLSVIMQLSMSMGVAIAAAILSEFTGVASLTAARDVIAAFAKTFLCLGFLAAISTVIFIHIKPDSGKVPPKNKQPPVPADH